MAKRDDPADASEWEGTGRSKLNGQTPPDPTQPARGTLHGRLLVLGMDDIDTAPPRDYLLKGIISPNEISIWVGPPKCGKSFLLMYVAYKLALGQRVFGLRVKPTKVLYVAAEGEGGIAKRLQALRGRYGRAENFHYIAQPIDLMRDGGHSQEVITAANAVGAQLIIVDTLNRALAGGNENGPEDMGAFICNVAEIRTKTRAHIAIIHHGTKASDGRDPRGHGSIEGADDALIGVQKLNNGIRIATLIHSKDDADGIVWAFKLEMVDLGTDDDGDPITTLIVQETNETAVSNAAKPKPNGKESIALGILQRCINDSQVMIQVGDSERACITIEAWRAAYFAEANPDAENTKTKVQAFRRAVTGLQEKALIGARDGFVWRPAS
jgi:AAA domain